MDPYQIMQTLTERQKMEFAAKVVGYELHWVMDTDSVPLLRSMRPWNPLNNGEDSMRLAIDLEIQIEHIAMRSQPAHEVNCWPRGRGDCNAILVYSEHGGKYAATRKAIFECAVQLGISMK